MSMLRRFISNNPTPLAVELNNKNYKYILIWEADFNTVEDIINFIEKCFYNSYDRFFSSRNIDVRFFNEYYEKKIKQKEMDKFFIETAEKFSQKSHCESKKVAALAVKNNRIIATGINGTAPSSINCDEYFKNYHKFKNISIEYDKWKKTEEWRKMHHDWSNKNEIHAEVSLIGELARNGNYIKDMTIYISLSPCFQCVKLFASLGVKEIVYSTKYDKSKYNNFNILNNVGIIIKQFKK